MEKIIRSSAVTGSRRLSELYSNRRIKGKEEKEEKEKNSDEIEKEQSPQTANGLLNDIATYENERDVILSQSTVEQNYLDDVLAKEKKVIEELSKEKEYLTGRVLSLQEELAAYTSQIQERKEEGYKIGKEEGYAVGLKEREAGYNKIKTELVELIEILRSAVKSKIEENEELAVEIALITLCKIVESKIADKEFIVSAVKSVISNIAGEPSVVLRVNPGQLETLTQARKELESLLGGSEVKLVPDARVIVGGCMLETDKGNWDGRLEAQLQKLIDLRSNPTNPQNTR